jgi:hypothetical protein
MHFYGLLYVSDVAEAVNCSVKDRIDMLRIYAKNALVLSHSLSMYGGLTVLTNNARLLAELVPELVCCEIPFERDVPKGIAFRSAHHKLDVFKYFECLTEEYIVLLDLDMICISGIPKRLSNIVDNRIPIYYDISNQVTQAYGEDRILEDMQKIGHHSCEGRWAGGELIGGPPLFFKELNSYIAPVWTKYVACCSTLHHQGDEMIVSVSLEEMRRAGIYMIDAGQVGGVGRFWSGRIKHEQRKFQYYLKNCWLLHLPQDKKFLSDFADSIEINTLLSRYRQYLKVRLFKNWLAKCYTAIANTFRTV